MEVEYKRDIHHNYMVIKENEDMVADQYCIKMLSYHSVEGILPLERRSIDNQSLFYYDITAKQALNNLFDKIALPYQRVKSLFVNMIAIIERAGDYLLIEDDFILMPEYVFIDVTMDTPFLCYRSGYRKDIKEQMSSFIEYIMNKVDYKDDEAVLLIYSLYMASKEEGFTFHHLLTILQKQNDKPVMDSNQKGTDFPPEFIPHNSSLLKEQQDKKIPAIPMMMEKLLGEKEVQYYEPKTYIFTAACILGGALIVSVSFLSKIIFNSMGNRIDLSKLFALLLILLCVEGYLLAKIWDKKNQITKIIAKEEYVDPQLEKENINIHAPLRQGGREERKQQYSSLLCDKEDVKNKEYPKSVEIMQNRLECNPTCLLSEMSETPRYILASSDEIKYESIEITEFPFFIGKIKKNVDYCLDNNAVSRYHAKLTCDQGQFFITDLNSTNGTFLNKEALKTYQRKEVAIGDEIAFANLKYRFLLQ